MHNVCILSSRSCFYFLSAEGLLGVFCPSTPRFSWFFLPTIIGTTSPSFCPTMARMNRPAPVEVCYKNMRFLITHNPTNATLSTFLEVRRGGWKGWTRAQLRILRLKADVEMQQGSVLRRTTQQHIHFGTHKVVSTLLSACPLWFPAGVMVLN